jgi:hypothetical protein
MPHLALHQDPDRDARVTSWVAIRVAQRMINSVRDDLGFPPLTEASVRVLIREVLQGDVPTTGSEEGTKDSV